MGRESPIAESRSNDTYESKALLRFMFVMDWLSRCNGVGGEPPAAAGLYSRCSRNAHGTRSAVSASGYDPFRATAPPDQPAACSLREPDIFRASPWNVLFLFCDMK